MSYKNPGGPGGMLTNDNKKEENTTTDAGQLGYHETNNKGIKDLTNAMNNTNPGEGPMRKSSTAGTYNFSSGFTLGGGASGSFANKHISDMRSNVSKAKGGTGISNQYSKAEQRWKDAGGVEIKKTSEDVYGGDKFDIYQQKNGDRDGYTITKGEAKDFKEHGVTMAQGPGAIPKAKDGVSIHKGPGGNIIENIEGTPGKTRDKAIIYKSPTSGKNKNTSVTTKNKNTNVTTRNKNINRNNLESPVTVHEQIKGKIVPGTGVTYEAGTSTGLNSWKATAEANKAYKASNQYKKDQKAKLKKTRSEAKENLKLGVSYDALSKTHKRALEGTRIGKKHAKAMIKKK
jgi:hypothetical protein